MYPYTQNTGSLLGIIKAIGTHGVPDKFTSKELPVWGFKSSNDRNIPNVLKFIGFLDGSAVPGDLWKEARTKPEQAVAKGVRAGYSELFKTFPDAHRKDVEALTNFFKAKTTVGDAVVKQMVATFRALAQYGAFDGAPTDAATAAPVTPTSPLPRLDSAAPAMLTHSVAAGSGLTVNLNIELSVPVDATGEVYEKFFAAMKKHLIDAVR